MNRKLIVPLGAVAAIAVLMLSATLGLTQGATNAFAPAGAVKSTQSAGHSGTTALAPGVTAAICGQTKVPLGAAWKFHVLAGTTVTNTGHTTVTGSVGVSPGSAVTGFPPGTVTGKIHKADRAAALAQADMGKAYNNAMGRTNCPVNVAGNLGGRTLGPGLYHSTSSLAISSGDLTLTAHGHSGKIFIFQVVSKFTMTSGRQVILAGGALAANIYWVIGSSATLGTTAVLYGNILAHKSISMANGAKLHGRALAHIGAVTMIGDHISHVPIKAPSVSHPLASHSVARGASRIW